MHMRVMGYVPESTKRMGCLSIARRFPVELVLTETRQTGGGAAGSGRALTGQRQWNKPTPSQP
jgi:hypothetical protein